MRHSAPAPKQTRHTFATICLMTGANPAWVARQLGHRSTKMLYEVYSRWIDGADRGFERAKVEAGIGQHAREEVSHFPYENRLAERAGFEPALGDYPKHAFQACDLNRSSTSPGPLFYRCGVSAAAPRRSTTDRSTAKVVPAAFSART